jgi:hypothetical protein
MVLGTAASESCVAAIEAMRFPRMRTVWSLSSAPVATLITVTWRIEVSGAGWSCAVANATESASVKRVAFTGFSIKEYSRKTAGRRLGMLIRTRLDTVVPVQ